MLEGFVYYKMVDKNCNVEAVFWTENNTIYRNKTKIIFNGNQGICNGIVLMSNPGSCNAVNEGEISNTPRLFRSTKQPFLRVDSTQRIVYKIVGEAYGDKTPLNFVSVVNLCDKRERYRENLSKEDFKRKNADEIVNEIENEFRESKNQIRWIWLAFGVESKGTDKESILELVQLKEKSVNMLKNIFDGKIVGDKNPWHPIWLNYKRNLVSKQSIIKQIRNKI